jgi:hypothetical protein
LRRSHVTACPNSQYGPCRLCPGAALKELPQPGGGVHVGQIAVTVHLPDLPRVLVLGPQPLSVPVVPRKLPVLQQVDLPSPSRRVAQILVEAAGRAYVLRASARYKEVAPMTDKISQRPVPPLDPPERFAGGEVVAAARCPVDVSTFPRRHVIVVKYAGERQTFSVHEVAHNHVEWVGGQGHYDRGYAAAIRLMAEKVAGRARRRAVQ